MQRRLERITAMTTAWMLGVASGVLAPSVFAQEEDEIRLMPFDVTDPSPGGGPFDLHALMGIDVSPEPIGPEWSFEDPTAPSIIWSSADDHDQFALAGLVLVCQRR